LFIGIRFQSYTRIDWVSQTETFTTPEARFYMAGCHPITNQSDVVLTQLGHGQRVFATDV